jgi:hypothetical protein
MEKKYKLCHSFFILYFVLINFITQVYKDISMKSILYPKCDPQKNIPLYAVNGLELKNFITYQKDFNDKQQLHIFENEIGSPVIFYSSSVAREFDRLVHLKNVYVSSWKMVATRDAMIKVWENTEEVVSRSLETGTSYESVVYLYSPWGEVFGHFLHDSLTALIQIPKEIVDKSVIVMQYYPPYCYNYLDFLGYPRNKFVFHYNEYVFAENLYMYVPVESRSGQNVVGIQKLRDILTKKLNLDKIHPNRYVLSNRPKKGYRYIQNFDELVGYIRTNFTNIEWEVLSIPFSKIDVCGRIMRSIKIWFSPCGSNINNVIFMAKGSGVCIAMSQYIDMPNYGQCITCGIWAVGFNNFNMIHHKLNGGNCSSTLLIKSIDCLLYAMKYGQFQAYNNSFHPFNISKTKRKLENNPSQIFIVSKDEMMSYKNQ